MPYKDQWGILEGAATMLKGGWMGKPGKGSSFVPDVFFAPAAQGNGTKSNKLAYGVTVAKVLDRVINLAQAFPTTEYTELAWSNLIYTY